MNNEEKILAMLEQMNGRLDNLEQGQKELHKGIQDANARIDVLQDSVDERFDKVDVKLDNIESSVNYAASDAHASIKRHEKEFHNVG